MWVKGRTVALVGYGKEDLCRYRHHKHRCRHDYHEPWFESGGYLKFCRLSGGAQGANYSRDSPKHSHFEKCSVVPSEGAVAVEENSQSILACPEGRNQVFREHTFLVFQG